MEWVSWLSRRLKGLVGERFRVSQSVSPALNKVRLVKSVIFLRDFSQKRWRVGCCQ